jgi:hypothetical protein
MPTLQHQPSPRHHACACWGAAVTPIAAMPSIAHPAINRRAPAPWLVRIRIIASTKLPVAHIHGRVRRFRRIANLNILKTRTTGNAVPERRRRMRLVSGEMPRVCSPKNPRHFSPSAGIAEMHPLTPCHRRNGDCWGVPGLVQRFHGTTPITLAR